jgi:Xaa-Pro aminopeptidase
VAPYWNFLAYLSGFSGEQGTLVIGKDKAGLWTDSRFFLQAEAELEGSSIELFRQGLPKTPTPEEWILKQGYRTIGIDGALFSANEVLRLTNVLSKHSITLITTFKPYQTVWIDRPAPSMDKVMLFPEKWSGESMENKLKKIRAILLEHAAEGLPVSTADDIAWLLNLRGNDIEYNPVPLCFLFVTKEQCLLFIDQRKLDPSISEYLRQHQVETAPYEFFPTYLCQLKAISVLIDKDRTNYEIYDCLSTHCQLIETIQPVARLKAVKNPVETEGFRQAMIKDGVAYVRFFRWLETALATTAAGVPAYGMGCSQTGSRTEKANKAIT